MKPGWPRRTIAFAVVLVTSAVASIAAAIEPPPTYCQLNRLKCHKLVGPTRMHFVGLAREALRAVPKVPGYRCHEDIVIDKQIARSETETGFRNAALANYIRSFGNPSRAANLTVTKIAVRNASARKTP